MNIIVRPYGSDRCCCRPDTTLERENRDFWVPDCLDRLYYAPAVFARISKAGKCVREKFASRYYDAVGFGILAYTGNDDLALCSCADHTSILPMPLYDPSVFEKGDNIYKVCIGGVQAFETRSDNHLKNAIEEAICKASALTSLRTGDLIATELAPLGLLSSRVSGSAPLQVKGTFCENTAFEFSLIF